MVHFCIRSAIVVIWKKLMNFITWLYSVFFFPVKIFTTREKYAFWPFSRVLLTFTATFFENFHGQFRIFIVKNHKKRPYCPWKFSKSENFHGHFWSSKIFTGKKKTLGRGTGGFNFSGGNPPFWNLENVLSPEGTSACRLQRGLFVFNYLEYIYQKK